MNSFHIPTIVILGLMIGTVMLLILLHTRMTRKTYPGHRVWTVGTSFWLLGLTLSLLLRGNVPLFWSIVIGNSLIMLHPALFLEAINRFHAIPSRWWRTPLNLALILSGSLYLNWLGCTDETIIQRSVVINSILAFMFLRIMAEPLLVPRARRYSMQILLSVSLVPIMLLFLIRTVSLLSPGGVTSYSMMISQDFLLTMLLLLGVLVNLVMNYCYIALTSDRVEDELRESRERLKTLAEAQRHFFRIVSHEFKTPLAVIDRSAQMISLGDTAGNGPLQGRVEGIRENARRMTDLIDICLNDATLSRGELELDFSTLDLAELLGDVAAHHRSHDDQRTIGLTLRGGEAVCRGDRKLLFHLFSIIIDNALKFSQAPDPVEICLEADRKTLRVTVRDRGVGIPPEQLGKVGTPAFRAETARFVSGSGFGFHTARMIASLHGGAITIDSSLGEGTVVATIFPQEQ